QGFVADWPNSRTGWELNDPGSHHAPERRWNPTRNKIERRPDDKWRRVIWLPIAVADERFIWTQASYGAWEGLVALMAAIRTAKGAKQVPKLPFFSHLGSVPALGGTSLIPTFACIRFVDIPSCLIGATNGEDTQSSVPAVYASASRGGDLDDAIPF